MYKEKFNADDLLSVEPGGVVRDPKCVDVSAFEAAFRDAAKGCDEAGNARGALAYRVYATISEFHFRPEDKAEPFSNLASFADGSRTLVGSDFDIPDFEALEVAAEKIHLLPLRVRLADMVWWHDKSKDRFARTAIDGYVRLVSNVLDGTGTLRFERSTPTGISVEEFLERAFVIARAVGWDRAENDPLRETYFSVLDKAVSEGGFALVRFARLGMKYGVEGLENRISDLSALAQTACENEDFHEAEALQELANAFLARQSKGEVPSEGSLLLAKIHEARADASPSSFLKTHALQNAIDALQGAKGVRDERQRLHEKLKEAQLHIADEMGSFSHSIDISDEVERLLRGYEGLDLLECLRRLALTELPKDPEMLEQKAREEAEKYPLSSLFSASLLDAKGRTVARTDGGLESSEALRHKIIQHQGISNGLAVGAAIAPARSEITKRFQVRESLLAAICGYSPFVVNGHEIQIARGFQAFLYGDDMVACSLLFPYLEAGLRELVTVAGRSDTTISIGGIEQTIGLGKLLSEHRDVLEQVFGANQIFAIENLFAHEFGPKLRHSYCHGLATDGHLMSDDYIYGCKLVFSLVMLPLINKENWPQVKPRLEAYL